MAGILLSGPAGGGKSARARELAAKTAGPVAIADFQSIFAALTLARRGPDGRYPDRGDGDGLLPLTETIRQAVATIAAARAISIVMTNSDGDQRRRSYLLNLLGAGAVEEVVDPGRRAVERRLEVDGNLSPD